MAFSFFSNDTEFQNQVLKQLKALTTNTTNLTNKVDNLNTKYNNMVSLIRLLSLQIDNQGEELMTKITDQIQEHGAKMEVFFARLDASVTGISGDFEVLKNMITDLQNATTDVELPAEAKAILDNIEAHTGVIADKIDALDALTPPVAPVVVEPVVPPVEPTV